MSKVNTIKRDNKKMRMNKIDKLKEKERKTRMQIYNIEKKELEQKILPKAKKLIGKCFKYSNSYSGSNDSRWWLYQKILSISTVMGENSVLVKINEFQKDCRGKIDFQANTSFRDLRGQRGWIKISNKTYEKEKKKLVKILEKL